MVAQAFQLLKKQAEKERSKLFKPGAIVISCGSATCENAAGAQAVYEEFSRHIKASARNDIYLRKVGCTGRCSLEPIVSIEIFGNELVMYQKVDPAAVHEIFMSHVMGQSPLEKYRFPSCAKKEKTSAQLMLEKNPSTREFLKIFGHIPFFCDQTRVALRNCGLVDPENIFDYIFFQGFGSFANILERNDPDWVIQEVEESHLRGRGGAGFSTGLKWKLTRQIPSDTRYVICNADEGDPGAFMDRSMLESDPFSVIEGLMIAGFAIGAHKGFFYVRAEYPLAVERIEKAIKTCRDQGILGNNIFGSNFSFDIEVRLGAGAFVCGEETALIHSIEGERGQPRIRPPFPAESGLFKKPTSINNVETLANIPLIFSLGKEPFALMGTKKSGGTKVFAVSGKIMHAGLVEVPMGTTLKTIVFDICGGAPQGKKIKAIQTGGPAGGCIPFEHLDTPIDYETLTGLGSIMGSGGLIVIDEDDCMVDFAKFFISFSCDESCGKCTPCREGTMRLLEILEKITNGKGEMEDLVKLKRLSRLMQKASLCGLGRGASNPILSALKFFEKEFEAHVVDKKCISKKCTALTHYEIDEKKCVGCTMCARHCPVQCIQGERQKVHVIDQLRCIKCGRCFEVCRFNAVKKE